MRRKILVCDDEPVLRGLVREVLGDDYEIAEACDGGEALELARRERPDLILLDVMMPVQSGEEVLRALREDPETAHLPVVVLSARAQRFERMALLAGGATHFLAKPFRASDLRAMAAAHLRWPMSEERAG